MDLVTNRFKRRGTGANAIRGRAWVLGWLAVISLSGAALSGCGLKSWWGEETPKGAVVEKLRAEDECPGVRVILGEEDAASEKALRCWSDRVLDLWNSVEGQLPDALTDGEIAVLLNKKIFKLSSDPEHDLAQIRAAKSLLGISGPITRQRTVQWASWLGAERASIRRLYQIFHFGRAPARYADLEEVARVLEGFAAQLSWRMSSDQLAANIGTLYPIEDPDIRRALVPLVRNVSSLLAMVCPQAGPSALLDLWDVKKTGECATALARALKPGAAWIEFTLNPVRTKPDRALIENSLDQLGKRVATWFAQPGLVPFPVDRAVELSTSLGAPPPPDFKDSLRWVTRIQRDSSAESLSPKVFSDAFNVFKTFQLKVIDGISAFLDPALVVPGCEQEGEEWTQCVLARPELARRVYPSIDLAFKVRNIGYGERAVPFTGHRFVITMFYDAVAEVIIRHFAKPGEKLIYTDLRPGPDGVTELLGFTLQFFDNATRFVDNVRLKLRGEPIVERPPLLSLNRVDLKGLARLVTLSSDLLVLRTPEERTVWNKLLSNLLNRAPRSAMYLDQLSITAVLSTVDLLSGFRDYYLSRIPKAYQARDPKTGEEFVDRAGLMTALPDLLFEVFPRTYEACERYGFKRSCALAFDSVLPEGSLGKRWIAAGDLDVLSLIALGFEGVVDTCDQDGVRGLTAELFDGNDELDCGFVRIKDGVSRLFDSKLITTGSRDRDKLIEFYMDAINSSLLSRGAIKVGLITGRFRGGVTNLPDAFRRKAADEGSILALLGDILNPAGSQNLSTAEP